MARVRGGSRPALLPFFSLVAGLLILLHFSTAFLVPRSPAPSAPRQLRPQRLLEHVVRQAYVWPSPEAEAKLQKEGDLLMYPTHNWGPGMHAVVPATRTLDNAPVIIGVAADSGCGKSTFLRRILRALGTEVQPGHTAVGDMMTVLCLDDYHINDRAGRKVTGLTALDAKENDLQLMAAQMRALKEGKAINKPIYNHDTGIKDPPELIEPNKVVVIEGLHPMLEPGVRNVLDLAIYIDIVDDVKFSWKVHRDVTERGWTEEQVKADIEKRKPDFKQYVDTQKSGADVILRYEISDHGLPYLKVKLIQKKKGKFPVVTLAKPLFLKGPESRQADLKGYDEDWFGEPATVIEMDGEFDMADNDYVEQLKEVEENLVGLGGKPGELSEAMLKTKDSPGSQNGTGLLQAIIAMKVREVYERLTQKAAA